MGLRRKTALYIGITLFWLIAVLYLTTRSIVLDGFTQQETSDTRRNVERVLGALQDSTTSLVGVTRDWSSWDDTYNFINGENSTYIGANFGSNITFVNNHINLVAYIDNAGKLVYAKAYDLNSNNDIPIPSGLSAELQPGRLLPAQSDALTAISGIIALTSTPLIVSAQPILTSDESGPRAGTLVFGRFLDAAEMQRLSKTTLFSLQAYPLGNSVLPADLAAAAAAVSDAQPVVVRPQNATSVDGYAVIRDVYDQPAMLLQVTLPREVYARGQDTLLYFLLALLAVGLIFAAMMALLLERLVLSRISQLSRSVNAVTASTDLATRVSLSGDDELAGLAGNVNAMLDALEDAQHERQASEERYRALVETSPYAIILCDLAGQVIFSNQQAATLHGYDKMQDLISRDIYSLFTPVERRRASANTRRTIEQGSIRNVEYMMLKVDGGEFPAEVSMSVLCDGDGQPTAFLTVAQDISARKVMERELSHQAYHDPLTGLANRAAFMERLSAALAQPNATTAEVGLLFLDLDDFKLINDSLGHKAGDELLVEVATRLARCVRRPESIARLGGDEFTILVDDLADSRQLRQLAERVLREFEAPVMLEQREVYINLSIGVASLNRNGAPDDLLRQADMAMYAAKRKGKGAFAVFETAMGAEGDDRVQLTAELRHALERNQLVMHYQPIVDLNSGRVAALEALVRWQHPRRGLLSPAEFVPLAEQTGLIVPLGRWVLQQSVAQLRQWQTQPAGAAPLRLCVNLSAKQFNDPALVDDVTRILAQQQVDPRWLTLEITESTMMDNSTTTLEILRQLRALGVEMAIDDFGTGYSALGYLKQFPITILKLDRSFTAGLLHGAEDAALAEATISFAHALKLRVVAEGIEANSQVGKLLQLGCDFGQGYHFAPPLPANKVASFLRTENHDVAASNSADVIDRVREQVTAHRPVFGTS